MKRIEQLPAACANQLNARIADEYGAQRHYTSASLLCDLYGLPAAGVFFRKEAKSEGKHAQMLTLYMVGRNSMPELPELACTTPEWKGFNALLFTSYDMELALLEAYKDSIKQLRGEHPDVEVFLQQFITIQTEAVAEYADYIKRFEAAKTDFEVAMLVNSVFG